MDEGDYPHPSSPFRLRRDRSVLCIFVGTPLQSLGDIVAVGDLPELGNGFCGAESRLIPISTISPAVLLSNLELQGKDEELVTPHILQRPKSLRRRMNLKNRKRRRWEESLAWWHGVGVFLDSPGCASCCCSPCVTGLELSAVPEHSSYRLLGV